MCGLVGALGLIDQRVVNIFRELLTINQLRGMHSTGIASVGPGGAVRLIKHVGPPNLVMGLKEFGDVVQPGKVALIGHGRFATVGEIVSKNAHPFHKENIVGAHNGTLSWSTKNALEGPKRSFGTDSEALFERLSEAGFKDIIPTLTGAWAIVAYDKVFKTFNMIRNNERPLSYCRINNNKTMLWASETWMLECALERYGLSYEKDSGPFDVVPNQLFTFSVPKSGKPVTLVDKIPLAGKPPTVVQHRRSSSYGFSDHDHMGRPGFWWDGEFYPEEANDSLPFAPTQMMPTRTYGPAVIPIGRKPVAATANSNKPGHLVAALAAKSGVDKIAPTQHNGLYRYNGELRVFASNCGAYRNKFETTRDWEIWKRQGGRMTEELSPIIDWVTAAWNERDKKPASGVYSLPKDERGRIMDQKTFDKRTRHGCSGCQADLFWGEPVKFTDHETVLGQCCYDDNELMSWLAKHPKRA